MPRPRVPSTSTSAGDSRKGGTRPELREKVRAGAENRPGIYRFTGPRGEVLYVGKSVRVRSRLLSYFREGHTGRVRELVRVAGSVDWEYVPNEFEALLRELRLIRGFRPRFNVRHRRERRFAWVKLTPGSAPRLVATSRPVADGGRYFGPFPAPRSLPRTLRDLAHALGLRDCPERTPLRFGDQLDLMGLDLAPLCARAELGSCPGPCAGLCTEADYSENVRGAVAFLTGRDDRPLERLAARMRAAAGRREFEHAGRLRDRIDELERLRSDLLDFGRFLKTLTFVYRVERPGDGATTDRDDRQAAAEGPDADDPRGYLVVAGRVRVTFDWSRPPIAALRRASAEPAPPPEALTASDREELFLVARWFRDRPGELEKTVPVPALLTSLPIPPSSPAPGRSRTPTSGRAARKDGPV